MRARFDGTGLHSSPAWHDTGAIGVAFDEKATGLGATAAHHWRARIQYHTAAALQHAGRWFSPPGNGWQEGDLRSSCASPPPAGSSTLLEGRSGNAAVLTWSAVAGAMAYDAVRGGLDTLRYTSGNVTQSVHRCLADDTSETTYTDSATPQPGNGVWYLVRAVSCGGPGSYDEGIPSQQGSRTSEIDASAGACP